MARRTKIDWFWLIYSFITDAILFFCIVLAAFVFILFATSVALDISNLDFSASKYIDGKKNN